MLQRFGEIASNITAKWWKSLVFSHDGSNSVFKNVAIYCQRPRRQITEYRNLNGELYLFIYSCLLNNCWHKLGNWEKKRQ
jgi:hypothetical protein